jgi:4-hydroxy-3-methylbut-2-enyl diphosphate reductase
MVDTLHVVLANPRGFCAGVERAVLFVERALQLLGAPLYVRHHIVHNRHVVQALAARGAVFVDELHEVPDGATVMFSAHGVSPAVQREAERRGLTVLDATCPLVAKVHLEVTRHARDGRELVLIGHAGHAEVVGISGHYEANGGRRLHLVQSLQDVHAIAAADGVQIAYAIQTTFSIDEAAPIVAALQRRFVHILGPRHDDICYATQNRQNAVKQLAARCDLVLVVGSPASANSRRLQETAERAGCTAYLVDGAAELQRGWFDGCRRVGLTSGASTPDVQVQEVIARLRQWRPCTLESDGGMQETVVFYLPKQFRGRHTAKGSLAAQLWPGESASPTRAGAGAPRRAGS